MKPETLQVALCGIGGYGAGYVREPLDHGASRGAVFAAAGDTQVWVPGLGSVLVQCYSENLLPSELGHVPWARSSATSSYPMRTEGL